MARVIDHGRVRRALARLEALLQRHPELRERTAAYLAGDLPAGEAVNRHGDEDEGDNGPDAEGNKGK
jgi:hypothetical protein